MNIIQIGCNDGKDHVFDFVNQNLESIDNLILIDVNKNCIDYCKNIQYKDIKIAKFLFCAITNTNDEHALLYIDENSSDGRCPHASLNKNHVIEHLHPVYSTYKVPAKNINTLFEELNFPIIDRLYIDVESLDVDLVNAIDFNKYDIKLLVFEAQHSDGVHSGGGPRLKFCLERLKSFNYQIKSDGMNITAIKNS